MNNGCAQASTDGQSMKAQVRRLTRARRKKVIRDVVCGAKTHRAHLRRLLGQNAAGDMLTVTQLDRSARATRDLLSTVASIAERKAAFRSLADTWADTTTAHGRQLPTVQGDLAELGRGPIRARTNEGRNYTEARGQSIGRPPKLTPKQQHEARGAAPRVRNRGSSLRATTSAERLLRDWRGRRVFSPP